LSPPVAPPDRREVPAGTIYRRVHCNSLDPDGNPELDAFRPRLKDDRKLSADIDWDTAVREMREPKHRNFLLASIDVALLKHETRGVGWVRRDNPEGSHVSIMNADHLDVQQALARLARIVRIPQAS
jgi:hypothetical protein